VLDNNIPKGFSDKLERVVAICQSKLYPSEKEDYEGFFTKENVLEKYVTCLTWKIDFIAKKYVHTHNCSQGFTE
jgi:hypothetical protein